MRSMMCRAIGVFFALTLGCGLLFAGGQGEAATSAEEMVDNVNKTGLPIVKQPITIELLVKPHGSLEIPASDIAMWDVITEETNIGFDIQEVPMEGFDEKLNLVLASGQLPDLIGTGNEAVITRYYDSGLVVPINEYVDEWAPNVAEILDDRVNYNSLKSPDGNVYAFPAGIMAPWLEISRQLFINKVWLDELGIEMPTTTEEFKNALVAMKEGDPNGNGIPDEIPFTVEMQEGNNDLLPFFGMFGLPLSRNSYDVILDGEYVFGPAHEAFREGLRYFNELYVLGCFDEESFSQTKAQLQSKGRGEHQAVGSLVAFWARVLLPDREDIPVFEVVPPLKHGNAEPLWVFNQQTPRIGAVVSAGSDHRHAIFRLMDYINESPQQVARIKMGPESNGSFNLYEDGTFDMIHEDVDKSMGTIFWMLEGFMTAEETHKYRRLGDDWSTLLKLDYVDVYRPYANTEYAITKAHWADISTDDRDVVNSFEADTKSLVENFIATSILRGITDNSWETFQENLKRAGLDRYVEIKSAAVDAFYEN